MRKLNTFLGLWVTAAAAVLAVYVGCQVLKFITSLCNISVLDVDDSLCWLPGGKIYYIAMLDFSVPGLLMIVHVGCQVVKLKSHVAKFKTVRW